MHHQLRRSCQQTVVDRMFLPTQFTKVAEPCFENKTDVINNPLSMMVPCERFLMIKKMWSKLFQAYFEAVSTPASRPSEVKPSVKISKPIWLFFPRHLETKED